LNLYDFTLPQLVELIAPWGGRPIHAARLWRYLYREHARDIGRMLALPPRLRERLAQATETAALEVALQIDSQDRLTRKLLLRCRDGRQIETVRMRYRDRATACLSSQAGCALGCVFCATGQAGFGRNLTPGEIVAQAIYVDSSLAGPDEGDAPYEPSDRRGRRGRARDTLRNVVFMGMGEPLLNYEAVLRAVDILSHPAGMAIGAKRVTLSTVGVVPGIVRLADDARPVSLAVSLHAADQDERAALIPAARAWPLSELLAACRYYTSRLGRRIFFEWTLIESQNDTANHARSLAELLRGIPAHVNLIPLNPTAGFAGKPGRRDSVDRFRTLLQERGLPTTVRQRRGIDIAAGCGQLAGALV
jgi:23S rRNA (adenine2503-C2)-methyltransferase